MFCYLFNHYSYLFMFRFFFFNDTATTEIYTLSLHDALPISIGETFAPPVLIMSLVRPVQCRRSEEHTSELQSPYDLVCRLLLEKKTKLSLCPASSRPISVREDSRSTCGI